MFDPVIGGGAATDSGVLVPDGSKGAGGSAGKGPDVGAPDGAADAASPPSSSCPFSSGLNLAWVRFANDVPNPDIAAFNTIFKNTYDAGGRAIRWWFHTNGSTTPGYDASGHALPIPPSHIEGVKSILNAANANKVKLIITLWSFDMLQANAGEAHTNNSLLLENDAHRQAYIDNYLTPLVRAVKDTPGLYAWDIFNEPEGMGPAGRRTAPPSRLSSERSIGSPPPSAALIPARASRAARRRSTTART